jgi:hypothetical protein
MARYPAGLVESLQKALEEVIPDHVDVDMVQVQNDTFGNTQIPVNTDT